MAVNLPLPASMPAVDGVTLASGAAGIRYQGRDDLLLMQFAPGTQVAAVFTQNAFCAAPVVLAKQHLTTGQETRALLINSGNANAGTGQLGLDNARQSCAAVAEALDCKPEQVLPFSTGVIGEQLKMSAMLAGVKKLAPKLAADGWNRAAETIMTTDTQPKAVCREFEVDGKAVRLVGIAKGAGMIRPDMATMLSFIATDAPVARACLQDLLYDAVDVSFNRITVDGDTSTNDACLLAATAQVDIAEIQLGSEASAKLRVEVSALCEELAQAIVRDAEGANRFITVAIDGALSEIEARDVAYTIAHSPLVKTAAFAGDPNWGRILVAIGRAGVAGLDVSKIDLYLDSVCLLQAGEPAQDYTEEAGAAVAGQAEFTIRANLGRGEAGFQLWTSDLSYDYVRINAEYRS